jgi:aminoglycoside phosphotransferase family enzyme
MKLEIFLIIYDAWKEVRSEFSEELKARGIKRTRLPHLAVLHDIGGVVAYYHAKTNTVVVSAKKVEEIARKWQYDIKCVAKSILYHELAHFFYTKLRGVIKDYNSEEKEAEVWEFSALASCLGA